MELKCNQTPLNVDFSDPFYDVIIIGAGLGGLTVGNILAYQGYKVLIVDKNHQPGGCVVNFHRKEFRFDTAIHFINGCGPGGMVHTILKSFDAENAIDWLPIDNLIHWVDPGNCYEARPPVLLSDYIEFLCREFPHESKNVRKFYSDFRDIIPMLWGLISPSLKVKGQTLKNTFPVFLKFMGSISKSVDDVVSQYFSDPALIEFLTLFVAPFGNTRDKESFFVWYMSDVSYKSEGAWYPRGGAGEFTAKLAQHYIKLGGNLLLNHEVTQVLIEKKKAKGIICQDRKGNSHQFYSKHLVNASDLNRFVNKLVPPNTFSPRWIKKINNHDTQHSLVSVYLGLNIDIKDYGISDYELWHLNNEWRTPAHYRKIFEELDYSQLPMEVITFYNNGPDKSCCPPGKSVISILSPTHIEVWNTLLEDGKKGPKYLAMKRKVGEMFITRLAELLKIPDLASHVDVIEVATPITLNRYNYAHRGTPIGYSFNVDSMKKTQLFGTSISNITLAGQFVFPCGGMSSSMLGGFLSARSAVKKLKKAGFAPKKGLNGF
jgi:prolycopene isomerase